jgi:hypothetical protein
VTGEERGGNHLVEVELPNFLPFAGVVSPESGSLPVPKVQMSVRRERELFTHLEGVCSLTQRPVEAFRCCLCDKVLASLFFAVSHLATHFDPKGQGSSKGQGQSLGASTVFQSPSQSSYSFDQQDEAFYASSCLECRQCELVFNSPAEMAVHLQHKHGMSLSDLRKNLHGSTTPYKDSEDDDDEYDEDGDDDDDDGDDENRGRMSLSVPSSKESLSPLDDFNNNTRHKRADVSVENQKNLSATLDEARRSTNSLTPSTSEKAKPCLSTEASQSVSKDQKDIVSSKHLSSATAAATASASSSAASAHNSSHSAAFQPGSEKVSSFIERIAAERLGNSVESNTSNRTGKDGQGSREERPTGSKERIAGLEKILSNSNEKMVDQDNGATTLNKMSAEMPSAGDNDLDDKAAKLDKSSTDLASNHDDKVPDDRPSSPTSSKGLYRCPKCHKRYMTSFLLDRHLKFHSRQSAIETAMKAGVSEAMNGLHKDLLLHPPPVLLQNADKLFHELGSGASGLLGKRGIDAGDGDEEMGIEDVEKKTKKGGETRKKCEGVGLNGGGMGHRKNPDATVVDDAKKLLEKEGLQGDVVVVMPSDPDLDGGQPHDLDPEKSAEYAPELNSDAENRDMETDMSESEIRSSPKRRLSPCGTGGMPPAKSRRKASLPTRFRSRESESSAGEGQSPQKQTSESEALSFRLAAAASLSLLSSLQFGSVSGDDSTSLTERGGDFEGKSFPSRSHMEEPSSLAAPLSQESCRLKTDFLASLSSASASKDRDGSAESTSASDQIKDTLEQELLRSQQSRYLQNIHAAFAASPAALLSNRFRGKNSLAAAAAMAGYLRQFGAPPPGVVTPSFGLHAASSSSSLLSPPSLPLPMPPHPSSSSPSSSPSAASVRRPVEEAEDQEEEKAEDLSLPTRASKTLASPGATLDLTSKRPSKPDGLFGCPKVQWDANHNATRVSDSFEEERGGAVFKRFHHGSPADVHWGHSSRSRGEGQGEEGDWSEESRSPPPLSLCTSSDSNGSHPRSIWHTFSGEDVRSSMPTADGRKVTSLSRTHSR